ncbi:signal peptidase II [Candidatus Woesearchaeota archaeon]|nr:signal peptidase II [Candidatus Woesearchaeota archaeon]
MDNKRLILAGISIIALDQLTKKLAQAYLGSGHSISIIPGIASLTYTTNTGAGFSLFNGMNTALIWLGIAIIGILLYYASVVDKRYHLPLAMIISGAAGNLIDRILIGHVVDFISVWIWPVFNVADSAVSIGAICLIINMVRGSDDTKVYKKSKEKDKIKGDKEYNKKSKEKDKIKGDKEYNKKSKEKDKIKGNKEYNKKSKEKDKIKGDKEYNKKEQNNLRKKDKK